MESHEPGLASWADAADDVFAAAGRVAAHQAFGEAARALASGMLELSASDAALDGIFKDAGRYAAAMWGFYLHDDGGLTLPRLKAASAASGLLSAGRARAQLHFLEHFGYLSRSHAGAKGAVVYAPTPAFVAAWDRHHQTALAAVRPIAPDVERLLGLDATAVRQTYGRLSAAGYLASMQREQPVPAFLRVFMHPHAGSHMLWMLLTSGADAAFPPARAGPVSIRSMAARSKVARAQVARILQEATATGMAHLDADGYVHFQSAARAELGLFYAIQLAQILAAGALAARQRGLLSLP